MKDSHIESDATTIDGVAHAHKPVPFKPGTDLEVLLTSTGQRPRLVRVRVRLAPFRVVTVDLPVPDGGGQTTVPDDIYRGEAVTVSRRADEEPMRLWVEVPWWE